MSNNQITTQPKNSFMADVYKAMLVTSERYKIENGERNAIEFASAISQLKDNNKLSIQQVKGAFMVVARKNLSFDKRHYYLINYGGQLQVQLGYMGIVDMANQNGVKISDPIPVYKSASEQGLIKLDENGKLVLNKWGMFLDQTANPAKYPAPNTNTQNFGTELLGFIVPIEIKGVTEYELVAIGEVYDIFKNFSNAGDAWKKSPMSMVKSKVVKLVVRKHQIRIANAGVDLQGDIQKIEGSHIEVEGSEQTQQTSMLSDDEQIINVGFNEVEIEQTPASVLDVGATTVAQPAPQPTQSVESKPAKKEPKKDKPAPTPTQIIEQPSEPIIDNTDYSNIDTNATSEVIYETPAPAPEPEPEPAGDEW